MSFYEQIEFDGKGAADRQRASMSSTTTTGDIESRRSSMSGPDPQLLPSIGIVEKKVGVTLPELSNAAAGPGESDFFPGKSPRRRSNHIRRASMEEIQYFTDLLRKRMVDEEHPVASHDDGKIMMEENEKMGLAEQEQCRVDRFWGFEYEREQQVRRVGGSNTMMAPSLLPA